MANEGQQTNWKFKNANLAPTQNTPAAKPVQEVSWSASEYIHHEKDSRWYLSFLGLSVLTISIIYLLTRDFISVVVLAVLAIAIVVFAKREPQTLNYRISSDGVQIGAKLYPVSMFRSFAVIEEGTINSIMLMPIKRFMPSITMYCAPEDEQKVVETLSALLPQEERQQDSIDKLMHKLRF